MLLIGGNDIRERQDREMVSISRRCKEEAPEPKPEAFWLTVIPSLGGGTVY